jgi:hypothetical protein
MAAHPAKARARAVSAPAELNNPTNELPRAAKQATQKAKKRATASIADMPPNDLVLRPAPDVSEGAEMLRGADGYLSMIREVEALGYVQGTPNPALDDPNERDNGERHPYAAMDAIVLGRLRDFLGVTELSARGRGFVQTMANAIRNERTDGSMNPEAWTPELLLTDAGYRDVPLQLASEAASTGPAADRISEGAEAARGLLLAIRTETEANLSQLTQQEEDDRIIDGRDYAAVAGMIEASVAQNIVNADPLHSQGFARALADLLCQFAEGMTPAELRRWDPIKVTAQAFASTSTAVQGARK